MGVKLEPYATRFTCPPSDEEELDIFGRDVRMRRREDTKLGERPPQSVDLHCVSSAE
jgi:hypothetical protein